MCRSCVLPPVAHVHTANSDANPGYERRCNTHWCWACGHAADEAAVYDHMWREHGGIGLVDDGAGAYQEEEDEGEEYIIRMRLRLLDAALE